MPKMICAIRLSAAFEGFVINLVCFCKFITLLATIQQLMSYFQINKIDAIGSTNSCAQGQLPARGAKAWACFVGARSNPREGTTCGKMAV